MGVVGFFALVATVVLIVIRFREYFINAEREKLQITEESEERFKALIENSSDAILMIEQDGRISYANATSLKVLGYEPGELLERILFDFIEPTHLDYVRRLFLEIRTDSKKAITGEFRIRTKKDTAVWVEGVAINLLRNKSVGAVILNLRDVTSRKIADAQIRKSREQLRALTSRLQKSREEERTQISREIHDQLGQVLTALTFETVSLEKDLSRNGKKPNTARLLSKVRHIGKSIQNTIGSVREIAGELRPAVLDRLGLADAIDWWAKRFQERTKIKITVALPEEAIEISQEKSTAIFRILQETLTNIARHSGATHANVRLEKSGGFFVLSVSDDGNGIERGKITDAASLGILGMKERALVFGGTVDFEETSPGTTVVVQIPVK